MLEKFGPCLEKGCSWCCDPVKIKYRKGYDTSTIPPMLDKNGNEIWQPLDAVWAPEADIDTTRVKTFNCVNYDKGSGKCTDYENRPDICRNTSCVDEDSEEPIKKQHKDFIKEKFIKMKK
jgi:Fe-S-cluster containining protein